MRRFPLAVLMLALSACTVGPDYQRPPTPQISDRWLEGPGLGEVDRSWWTLFNDPQLTALVERAVASSPDLREAEARLAEARANRDAVAGERAPQVSAKGSVTENVLSKNGQLPIGSIPNFSRDFFLFDFGFDASWELDFWGRRTRQVQGAEARAEAALEDRRDVMLTLIAEVARSYFDLRAAQSDVATAEALLGANRRLSELTALRFRGGEATRIEADRAEAAARTSAASLNEASGRAAAAAYRIATLVGATPETIVPQLKMPAPIPTSPDTIFAGIRSELLSRRPDIRRAERELAAATADIGVATADLFPRFSLLGSIGQQARAIGDLVSTDSTRLQIGPSFSWPIFSGGTIRARIRAADARADAAAARYEKAVIAALSDSEAAINRFANARAAAMESGAALEQERRAFELASLRSGRGEDDRLELERARLALTNAASRHASARGAMGTAAVGLFKALGGGWSDGFRLDAPSR